MTDEPSMIGLRDQVLDEAKRLVNTDRAKDYGDVVDLHKKVAAGWSQILGKEVKPHEVLLCMGWLKTCRSLVNPGHKDSYIDGAAYDALAYEVYVRTKNEKPTDRLEPVMESAPVSYPMDDSDHAIGFWAPTLKRGV